MRPNSKISAVSVKSKLLLTPSTVLIGENNAGKTSFLDAIYAVVGSGPRHLSEDDVYLAASEMKPPIDRSITVDLLIIPADENGDRINEFPEVALGFNCGGMNRPR